QRLRRGGARRARVARRRRGALGRSVGGGRGRGRRGRRLGVRRRGRGQRRVGHRGGRLLRANGELTVGGFAGGRALVELAAVRDAGGRCKRQRGDPVRDTLEGDVEQRTAAAVGQAAH